VQPIHLSLPIPMHLVQRLRRGYLSCRLADRPVGPNVELVERTVLLLVQSSNDAARKLLKAGHVRAEDLPPVETMRDEAADRLHRHFVTVTAEEDARRREFDAQVARATGRT
jgi:hypothetical protein